MTRARMDSCFGAQRRGSALPKDEVGGDFRWLNGLKPFTFNFGIYL